jgi:glycosyltransferase involved in cell wall biosynthesis
VRVGYDIAPLSLNWAGERRYAESLLRALRTAAGVEVEELTLWRREPAGMFQRVAYQAVAEAVYYPLLLGRRARRAGAELVHHPRHLVPPEHGLPGPSVVTVHDVLPLSEPEHYSKLILWRYRVLARSAVRSAALVLTGSRYSAGEIERRLGVDPARIRVTPYGVEERFRPAEVDRERLAGLGVRGPYVLCVGTLEPRKNLAGTVRAFERVQRNFPEHSLVLIGGRGWMGDDLGALLERTEARVVRPGYVGDEELVQLYSGADCFVFPSFSEGFGFPVLEAMACGAPVIAGDRASLPEVVGDAGVLVDPGDDEAIAGALAELLGSPERRKALRERGLEHSRGFSWNDTARMTVEAYGEVLAR